MFTIAVIIFDIIALAWSGIRILKKSKQINYPSGSYLGIGLILIAIAMFCYGARSIVVQFGPAYYWIDELVFYRPGTVIHSIGLLLSFLFVYKEFSPKLFAKISGIPVLGSMLFLAYAFAVLPVVRGIKQAPLEPIKFLMTNYPWASPLIAKIFLFITIAAPLIILGIFLYNAMKQERVKALFFGIVIPILSFFGLVGLWKPTMLAFNLSKGMYLTMFICALLLLILSVVFAKERKVLVKALLYGLGISFQCLFIPLCIFISPVFARLGYGIGAIMVYKAFGMKIE